MSSEDILNTEQFFAQALAMELAAAERYRELAALMQAEGNYAVVSLFRMMASQEADQAARIRARMRDAGLPPLPVGHGRAGARPETVPREQAHAKMTPLDALALSLAAEHRAQAFFEQVAAGAGDVQLRKLAVEFAQEESQHARMVERLIESHRASASGA